MPRNTKKSKDVDVSRFDDLVQEALGAFATDARYAVDICKQAASIERKRLVHRARKAVREAEEKAKSECAKKSFTCDVTDPCGTGECPFANRILSKIHAEKPGDTERPMNSIVGPYSIEGVVATIRKNLPPTTVSDDSEDIMDMIDEAIGG